MNRFDKVCAVPACLFGIVLLVLGCAGAFIGCSASLRLPPVVGVIPALVGWGIVRCVWIAWRRPIALPEPGHPVLSAEDWNMTTDARNELDRRLYGDQVARHRPITLPDPGHPVLSASDWNMTTEARNELDRRLFGDHDEHQ